MTSCPTIDKARVSLAEREGGYDVSPSGGFEVPVVFSKEDVRRGLMHREDVGNGMLFSFDTPRRPAFWMKNTLVPLDMEFLDADLNVVDAHRDVQPGDLTLRRPKKEVCFVLERPSSHH